MKINFGKDGLKNIEGDPYDLADFIMELERQAQEMEDGTETAIDIIELFKQFRESNEGKGEEK